MGLFDRVGRVIRANLNSLVNQAEDPEKMLEQAVQTMQDDLIQLRQAIALAIATQKRCLRQHAQAHATAEVWQQQAYLALQKGNESQAREALIRRQPYEENAQALQIQLDEQHSIIAQLKQSMAALEIKLAEARARKDMYLARARAAQASQSLHQVLDRVNANSSLGAFEQMAERVAQLETQAAAVAEVNEGDALEKQFVDLERDSQINQQLEVMKQRLPADRDPSRLPEG